MFNIGQKVRVNLKHVPEHERNCDVGQIVTINLFHRNSPLERVNYNIRFDKPYIKPEFVIYKNILEIDTSEGNLAEVA